MVNYLFKISLSLKINLSKIIYVIFITIYNKLFFKFQIIQKFIKFIMKFQFYFLVCLKQKISIKSRLGGYMKEFCF